MEAAERLLVAILVGILIGLDRERAEARKTHKLFAGVRTFPLIALAGAVPMLLIGITGPWLLVMSFVAVGAIAVVSYVRGSAVGDVGATTEIAALGTFLLGALAGAGEMFVAGAAGVAVAVLLVAKPRLEGFSRALTQEELAATLELAVISVIVLPLLPNRGYGPWALLNPFEIWLIVVLVSGLSFAGFVAMRVFGERRGMLMAGVIGALVSSTAVTVSMASQSRGSTALARMAAAGAVIASTVMCLRVAVLTGAINVAILPHLLPAVLVMGIVGATATWLLVRGTPQREGGEDGGAMGAKLSNPFSLTTAVTFAIMYAAILLAVRGAEDLLGTGGLYAAAVLGSAADVDALAIAFTRQGGGAMGWHVAATGVTVGMVTNSVVKLGIAVVMGAGSFRRYVVGALGAMAAAGCLCMAWLAWM